jgi:SAM-dependent methyltransferase
MALIHEPAALLDERVDASAPVQWRLGQAHCDDDCRWYHAPRQYLRALGIVRGVSLDSGLLLDALARHAAAASRNRVLISGAADSGTLAHVLAAYGAFGRRPHVTMVDRCRTPLEASAWYAREQDVQVDTHQASILAFTPPAPFDVICTHRFFSFFTPADRMRLLEHWRELLVPGGLVVTVSSIRASSHAGMLRQDHLPDAESIRARLRAVDADRCRQLGVEPAQVREWAEEWVRRKTTIPVRSADELRALFEQSGFRIVDWLVCGRAGQDDLLRVGVVAARTD